MPPREDLSAAPLLLPRSPIPDPATPPHLPPGRRIGDVIVGEMVGRGGMSEVYRVHRPAGRATMALKILDPRVYRGAGQRYQQMLFARLRREGRLQQGIRHPNIVRVEAVIETDDGPALLMEWVEGPGLDAVLARRDILSWSDVDDIAQGLMNGLAEAQGAGIVHRDVKPGNVLMTQVDGRWVPKLTDFGLAKLPGDGDDLTLTGQVMGTPGYMPPRQMDDAKHVDCSVDTYALGAVLYELTTGRRLVPAPRRGGPDHVERSLRDLANTDVPARMRHAIVVAVAPDGTDHDAADVLAFWRGTSPVSAEPWGRPWPILGVLATFAAIWLLTGIL